MEYTVKEYVGLRLETPLVDAIDERARQMGISRSDLIRQALRERFTPIDYGTNSSPDAGTVENNTNLSYAK